MWRQKHDMLTNIQSRIIHNNPKVETTWMYINIWMDKTNVVFHNSGIFFSHEKEKNSDTHHNMGEPWK